MKKTIQKKEPAVKIGKALPFQQLVDFQINDNYVQAADKKYYFYRYYPANTSIMTDGEIEEEIFKFGNLLDTLKTELSLFVTDKIEDLSEIKKFYLNLPLEFDYITSEIITKIDSSEVESASVQRSFYFIYSPNKEISEDDIYSQFAGKGYNIYRAQKAELAVLIRNFQLREFINSDIYTIEQEVKNLPKMDKAKKLVYDMEIQRRLSPHRIDFNIHYAEQNNFLRKTVMLKNFPPDIAPELLKQVATLRNTSFNMRLTPMDNARARTLIDQQIKNRNVQGGKNKATAQIDASLEKDAILSFFENMARNQSTVYHINVFIEMYGKDIKELRTVETQLNNKLAGLAVTSEQLKYEQKQAFKSVHPLGKDMFITDSNNMPSSTVAALYPSSFSCRLDDNGTVLGKTEQGGNFFLDFWLRDSYLTNGNFNVLGTSGQGKTTLLHKIITQNYIRGVKCFCLDPEDEYVEHIQNMGGTVINCANGSIKINPFEIRQLKTSTEEKDEADTLTDINTNTPVFHQHLSWLSDFHKIMFPKIEDMTHRVLMILIQDMYSKYSIDENTDISKLKTTDYPTYTELYNFLMEEEKPHPDIISDEEIRQCRLLIKSCYDGELSRVMNGHTNIHNDRLVCISLQELLQGSKERTQAVLFNYSTYIWNIISQRTDKVMLNIDELYLFLENPIMVKYLRSFVKRARKYDAILGIGTQQLGDCFVDGLSNYTTAIINNSAIKFLFYPEKMDLALMQEKLKLTDGETACISNSQKGGCLVKVGNERYKVNIELMDYEKALFGSAGGR